MADARPAAFTVELDQTEVPDTTRWRLPVELLGEGLMRLGDRLRTPAAVIPMRRP